MNLARPGTDEQRRINERNWGYADQIMTLFTAGESFRRISAATGVPLATVHGIVKQMSAEYTEQRYGDRTTVIARELSILDTLTRRNLRAAQNGDRDAASIVLASSQARRRLLGLDAALKAEITVKTAQDIEIERLVSMMKDDPATDTAHDPAGSPA
jgi:hypothetical protein